MQILGAKMAERIAHRGPDDMGVWVDQMSGVVLAHRRLSIVDLSPTGHQPMISSSGRYVIAFNGEIYNHLRLRAELESSSREITAVSSVSQPAAQILWRGHSDTETLLAGFESWGIEATLCKAVGMFAIALWDRKEKVLTLARDRIGEKPLYYGFQQDTFVFGSELKALKVHPDFLGEVNRDAICLYLRHRYIPAPYSIYKGISKLHPGTYVQLPFDGQHDVHRVINSNNYWDLVDVALKAVAKPFSGDEAAAITALDNQLSESVGQQMVADVPIGVFLSGGVDSSTVVALMQKQSAVAIKTFSIGFKEHGYNEAEYARAVALHLGTDHTELYVSAEDAIQVIPALARIYDEPFADSSQIPTFLLSKMTRQHVTVCLSGDAGDELFCGYNRYALTDMWNRMVWVPFELRRVAGRFLGSLAPTFTVAGLRKTGYLLGLLANRGEKLSKLAALLSRVDRVSDLYYGVVSEIDNPDEVVIGAREPETWLTTKGLELESEDAKLQMMLKDMMTYLPDDILVKVDRAAMANSLETRMPFLDHRVVKLAWELPLSTKMRDGVGKWILRQVLYKYVPRHLIERPKAGFEIPLGDWLRGPLREWAEAMLDEHRLRKEGFFNVSLVREKWLAHLTGQGNSQRFLWTILMFQTWLDEQVSET